MTCLPSVRWSKRARSASRTLRGYTLVEMLVVVTITSFVLCSIAVALHSLFRVEQSLRQGLAGEMSRQRLAERLRSDAHGAEAVEPLAAAGAEGETPPSGLVLVAGGERRVEYRTEGSRVVRLVKQGDRVAHREVFPLPPARHPRWEIARDQPLVLVALVLARGEQDGGERIEAAAGLDQQSLGVMRP